MFCVCAASGNYYYQDGFNKTISPASEHDVWYYNFIHLNNAYDVQADTDEINGNVLTIFINHRLLAPNGKLLGVVGVAVQLTDLQQLIQAPEETYDLSVYLVNRGGASNSFSRPSTIPRATPTGT